MHQALDHGSDFHEHTEINDALDGPFNGFAFMEGLESFFQGFMTFFFPFGSFFLPGSVLWQPFFTQNVSAGEYQTFLFRIDFQQRNFQILAFIFFYIITCFRSRWEAGSEASQSFVGNSQAAFDSPQALDLNGLLVSQFFRQFQPGLIGFRFGSAQDNQTILGFRWQ